MAYEITATDYKAGLTRKFLLHLDPMRSFKVNAEQAINARARNRPGHRWTVTEMRPVLVSAPF